MVLGLLTVSNPLKLWPATNKLWKVGVSKKDVFPSWDGATREVLCYLRECRWWAFHVIFWATRTGLCLVMNKRAMRPFSVFLTKSRANGQLVGCWAPAREFSELSCCCIDLCNTSFNWDLKSPGRQMSPNGRIHGSWGVCQFPKRLWWVWLEIAEAQNRPEKYHHETIEHMSHEKNSENVGLYRGLYYPII